MVATFRQPFDLLAETAVTAARATAGDEAKLAKTEIWLRERNPVPTFSDWWRKSALLTHIGPRALLKPASSPGAAIAGGLSTDPQKFSMR